MQSVPNAVPSADENARLESDQLGDHTVALGPDGRTRLPHVRCNRRSLRRHQDLRGLWHSAARRGHCTAHRLRVLQVIY